jgi:hypothetical protein
VVRSGSAGGLGFTAVSPAIRVLTHFDLQFGKTPLVARYQLGSTTRGIRAWDFDASLGLGVGW